MRLIILTALAVMMTGSAMANEVLVGDREIVLQTLAMESASKPEGMPYVAITLYNRALKRGTSMSEEALRWKQYSCWNSSKWAKAWLDKHYGVKVRLEASNALKQGILEAVAYPELRHYHTIGTSPSWAKGQTLALILGGHCWYEGIK